MHKYFLSFFFCLGLLACSNQGVEPTTEPLRLTVLHTNDHHGRFWQNSYGEYGMAARKTLVDQIRAEVDAEGGHVLLLSGGDINTGVPESDLLDAEPDFRGMQLLDYDAMAIGNHEFDNSLDVLMRQQSWVDFPFLSANIYRKSTGGRLFDGYTMFEPGGVRIAVIGLTTPDTYKLVMPTNVEDLEFRDPAIETRILLDELAITEKPALVFAVTHMGHYAGSAHGINAPGDVSLARSLESGELDMIIGGHSQEPVCMAAPNQYDSDFKPGAECKPDRQNGTWIVQAHEWGKYLGRADFEYHEGELTLISYQLIPVNLTEKVEIDGESQRQFVQDQIPEDQAMLTLLTPFQQQGAAQLDQVVASIDGDLQGERNQVRFRQTNLGLLIATAQMERVNADFGLMNSGGIRASIAAGDVSYKDVLTVQPFANTVAYAEMSGQEVLDYLNVVALKPTDSGAYVQFAGLDMQVGSAGVSNVLIQGKPLEPDQTYRFSLPSFSASGGDGYPKLLDHPGYVDSGLVDAQVLKDYLEQNSPLRVEDYSPGDAIRYP